MKNAIKNIQIFALGTTFVKQKGGTSISSRRLIYIRDLLYELVVGDVKIRYKSSLLGIGWSLLNPLMQLLVYQFVFGLILQNQISNYATFLFSGLLVWSWFQASLLSATTAIVDNRDLIKRPGFPMATLPVVSVTTELIHFVLALPILFIVIILEGGQVTGTILALPLVVVVQFTLTLSVAYLTAAIHVTFRDIKYLLGIVLRLFFFLTPIFYTLDHIPERYHFFFRLNPMLHLIEAYRAILMQGELPEWPPLLALGLLAGVILRLGYSAFLRASYHFVEEL